jgi:hypothetical protein
MYIHPARRELKMEANKKNERRPLSSRVPSKKSAPASDAK